MITVLILIAVTPAVAMTCVVALLRAWLRREDTGHSLKAAPVTRTSAVSRRVVGLYVRTPLPEPEDRQSGGIGGRAGPDGPATPSGPGTPQDDKPANNVNDLRGKLSVTTPFSPESFNGQDRSEMSQRTPRPGAVAGTVLRSARLSANLGTSQLAGAADVPEASLLEWEEGTATLAAVPSPVVGRLEAALRAAGAEARLVADLAAGAWCDLVIITIAVGEETDSLLADPLAAEDTFRELLTWTVADQPPARYRPYAPARRLLPAADLNLIAGVVRVLEATRPGPAPSAGTYS